MGSTRRSQPVFLLSLLLVPYLACPFQITSLFGKLPHPITHYAPPTSRTRSRISTHMSSSGGFQNKKRTSPSAAEFELQELRAQISGMQKAGLASANLTPEKQAEIESYVRSVATQRNSPVPLSELGEGDTLVGTWRLAFSTEAASLSVLPKEARVYVKIYNGDGRGRLDYILKFTERVFALRNLTAESTYTVDSSPINPGLVTFQYQKIKSDIFGLTVPTGLFGLLKGRYNYIESVYFDGKIWIDRGYSPESMEYFNVYVREEEEDDE